MQALISLLRVVLATVLAAAIPAIAQEITVLERRELSLPRADHPRELRLTRALLEGSGGEAARIETALRESANILAQCGIGLQRADLVRIGAPVRFQDYYVPYARALARALPLPRPTVYFVNETL